MIFNLKMLLNLIKLEPILMTGI